MENDILETITLKLYRSTIVALRGTGAVASSFLDGLARVRLGLPPLAHRKVGNPNWTRTGETGASPELASVMVAQMEADRELSARIDALPPCGPVGAPPASDCPSLPPPARLPVLGDSGKPAPVCYGCDKPIIGAPGWESADGDIVYCRACGPSPADLPPCGEAGRDCGSCDLHLVCELAGKGA